jgi:hypothetical protein
MDHLDQVMEEIKRLMVNLEEELVNNERSLNKGGLAEEEKQQRRGVGGQLQIQV